MSSDEGLDAYGAATWGQFFIYQGFNQHIGWMHTSTGVDSGRRIRGNHRAEGRQAVLPLRQGTAPGHHTRDRDSLPRERRLDEVSARSPRTSPITGRSCATDDGKWIAEALMNTADPRAGAELPAHQGTAIMRATMKVAELKANSSNNTLFADDKGEIAYPASAVHPEARQPLRLHQARRRQRSGHRLARPDAAGRMRHTC